MTDRAGSRNVTVAGSVRRPAVVRGLKGLAVNMDHAMIGAPDRSSVEMTLLEAETEGVLSRQKNSVVVPWIALFERPGGWAPDEIDSGPATAVEQADARDETPHLWDVIAAWRAADRELAAMTQDDPDWNRVHAELVGLRALHHRLFDARARHETSRREAAVSAFTDAARAWWRDGAPRPVPA